MRSFILLGNTCVASVSILEFNLEGKEIDSVGERELLINLAYFPLKNTKLVNKP